MAKLFCICLPRRSLALMRGGSPAGSIFPVDRAFTARSLAISRAPYIAARSKTGGQTVCADRPLNRISEDFDHRACACEAVSRALHGPGCPILQHAAKPNRINTENSEAAQSSLAAEGVGWQESSHLSPLFLIMVNIIDNSLCNLHTYELNVN